MDVWYQLLTTTSSRGPLLIISAAVIVGLLAVDTFVQASSTTKGSLTLFPPPRRHVPRRLMSAVYPHNISFIHYPAANVTLRQALLVQDVAMDAVAVGLRQHVYPAPCELALPLATEN